MVRGTLEKVIQNGNYERYQMIKVYLRGPFLTQSGYGHHSRTVLRALKTRKDLFDLYVQPIVWGQTSWLWEDNAEREEFDVMLNKTIEYINAGGTFDVSIQITIPNEWEKVAPVNIGVTAGIEATKVAPAWIEKSFLMNKIITISEFSKKTYEDTVYTGVNNNTGEHVEFRTTSPIEYVSYPVRKAVPKKINLELQTDFNFLAVAQLGPRKNTDQLIRTFVEQFKDNEDVGLIIKSNMAKNSLIDRENTLTRLKNVVGPHQDRKCKIYLLHGYLSEEEMAGLYTHPKVKALISTTHGEGFGLPLFEAGYYGLPIIATDWSGHLDFLYMPQKQKNGKTKKKHMFNKISYKIENISEEAVWKDVLVPDAQWAYPEEGSIKMNLEEMYKDHGRFKKRAKELEKWICKEFSEEKQYAEYVYQIHSVIPEKNEVPDDSWLDEIENVIKEYA